jgi:hypothetical protein
MRAFDAVFGNAVNMLFGAQENGPPEQEDLA